MAVDPLLIVKGWRMRYVEERITVIIAMMQKPSGH